MIESEAQKEALEHVVQKTFTFNLVQGVISGHFWNPDDNRYHVNVPNAGVVEAKDYAHVRGKRIPISTAVEVWEHDGKYVFGITL